MELLLTKKIYDEIFSNYFTYQNPSFWVKIRSKQDKNEQLVYNVI